MFYCHGYDCDGVAESQSEFCSDCNDAARFDSLQRLRKQADSHVLDGVHIKVALIDREFHLRNLRNADSCIARDYVDAAIWIDEQVKQAQRAARFARDMARDIRNRKRAARTKAHLFS